MWRGARTRFAIGGAVLGGALLLAALLPASAAAQPDRMAALPGAARLLLPEPTSLPAGVTLRTELRRYPVRGLTRGALAASLEEQAPRAGPRRAWGRTEWRLASHYRYGPLGDRCVVADARVRVEATILLPRWRDRGRAAAGLRRRWDAFRAGLAEHELGHRARAVEAGAALRAALLETSTPSCAELEARVDARTREIMEEWGDRQRAYDVATRQGRDQGARWPP